MIIAMDVNIISIGVVIIELGVMIIALGVMIIALGVMIIAYTPNFIYLNLIQNLIIKHYNFWNKDNI